MLAQGDGTLLTSAIQPLYTAASMRMAHTPAATPPVLRAGAHHAIILEFIFGPLVWQGCFAHSYAPHVHILEGRVADRVA